MNISTQLDIKRNIKPAFFKKTGRFLFYIIGLQFLFINQILSQEPSLPTGYQEIKNLNGDWLVYENNYKDYVPYLETRHYNYKSLSQYLEIENYQGYKLFLYSEAQSYLFINGTFQKKLPKSNWLTMDIDSLAGKFNNTPQILFTIFSENEGLAGKQLIVANKIKKTVSLLSNIDNRAALKARSFSNFNNFAILFSLFLLACVTALLNFQNNILAKYLSLKDLITITKRTDSIIINRPFDMGNILFMVILSFSISLILLILEYNFVSLLPKQLISNQNPSFINLVGQFFNLSFLTFLAFVLKYFFLTIIGNLYQLEKIINIHFFKNLQSTGIFAGSLLFIMLLLLINPIQYLQNTKSIYIIIVSIFYFLRIILLFFVIIKSNPVKNLYLFSYLCIVELIPLFIGIRFAL